MNGAELAERCEQQGEGWDLEILEREPGKRGFSIQPHCRVVEQSFAWFSRNRRLIKDYAREMQASGPLTDGTAARRASIMLVSHDPLCAVIVCDRGGAYWV